MALPEWPDEVPYVPLVGSWSMPEPVRPGADTELDGGNTRRRSHPGDNVPEIEFRIAMTREEWKILDAWFRDECSLYSSRFIMGVWLGDNIEERIVGFPPGFYPTPSEYSRHVAVAMRLRVYGEPV